MEEERNPDLSFVLILSSWMGPAPRQPSSSRNDLKDGIAGNHAHLQTTERAGLREKSQRCLGDVIPLFFVQQYVRGYSSMASLDMQERWLDETPACLSLHYTISRSYCNETDVVAALLLALSPTGWPSGALTS